MTWLAKFMLHHVKRLFSASSQGRTAGSPV